VIPSKNNPRKLFDPEPLRELKESIREHGVLVPITVYRPKGQQKYSILDGERRHRCCVELEAEGLDIRLPANVVDPPNKIAGLLYMFSIHNFRQPWELMPTALSLKVVMEELHETDSGPLCRLTGLSGPQVERCLVLLSVPERFQQMSLDPDSRTRIPSNFWIEALPVVDLAERELPGVSSEIGGREGILDQLVLKYRDRNVKSVIHFRRIMEAYEHSTRDDEFGEEPEDGQEESPSRRRRVLNRLGEYLKDPGLETRSAFDEFVAEPRMVQSAVDACDDFVRQLRRLKLNYVVDTADLVARLQRARDFVDGLLQKLAGGDEPEEQSGGDSPR
jgi:ParB/RepB/Spo0J family partition protein